MAFDASKIEKLAKALYAQGFSPEDIAATMTGVTADQVREVLGLPPSPDATSVKKMPVAKKTVVTNPAKKKKAPAVWTEARDEFLRKQLARNAPKQEIADVLGVSVAALNYRIQVLKKRAQVAASAAVPAAPRTQPPLPSLSGEATASLVPVTTATAVPGPMPDPIPDADPTPQSNTAPPSPPPQSQPRKPAGKKASSDPVPDTWRERAIKMLLSGHRTSRDKFLNEQLGDVWGGALVKQLRKRDWEKDKAREDKRRGVLANTAAPSSSNTAPPSSSNISAPEKYSSSYSYDKSASSFAKTRVKGRVSLKGLTSADDGPPLTFGERFGDFVRDGHRTSRDKFLTAQLGDVWGGALVKQLRKRDWEKDKARKDARKAAATVAPDGTQQNTTAPSSGDAVSVSNVNRAVNNTVNNAVSSPGKGVDLHALTDELRKTTKRIVDKIEDTTDIVRHANQLHYLNPDDYEDKKQSPGLVKPTIGESAVGKRLGMAALLAGGIGAAGLIGYLMRQHAKAADAPEPENDEASDDATPDATRYESHEADQQDVVITGEDGEEHIYSGRDAAKIQAELRKNTIAAMHGQDAEKSELLAGLPKGQFSFRDHVDSMEKYPGRAFEYGKLDEPKTPTSVAGQLPEGLDAKSYNTGDDWKDFPQDAVITDDKGNQTVYSGDDAIAIGNENKRRNEEIVKSGQPSHSDVLSALPPGRLSFRPHKEAAEPVDGGEHLDSQDLIREYEQRQGKVDKEDAERKDTNELKFEAEEISFEADEIVFKDRDGNKVALCCQSDGKGGVALTNKGGADGKTPDAKGDGTSTPAQGDEKKTQTPAAVDKPKEGAEQPKADAKPAETPAATKPPADGKTPDAGTAPSTPQVQGSSSPAGDGAGTGAAQQKLGGAKDQAPATDGGQAPATATDGSKVVAGGGQGPAGDAASTATPKDATAGSTDATRAEGSPSAQSPQPAPAHDKAPDEPAATPQAQEGARTPDTSGGGGTPGGGEDVHSPDQAGVVPTTPGQKGEDAPAPAPVATPPASLPPEAEQKETAPAEKQDAAPVASSNTKTDTAGAAPSDGLSSATPEVEGGTTTQASESPSVGTQPEAMPEVKPVTRQAAVSEPDPAAQGPDGNPIDWVPDPGVPHPVPSDPTIGPFGRDTSNLSTESGGYAAKNETPNYTLPEGKNTKAVENYRELKPNQVEDRREEGPDQGGFIKDTLRWAENAALDTADTIDWDLNRRKPISATELKDYVAKSLGSDKDEAPGPTPDVTQVATAKGNEETKINLATKAMDGAEIDWSKVGPNQQPTHDANFIPGVDEEPPQLTPEQQAERLKEFPLDPKANAGPQYKEHPNYRPTENFEERHPDALRRIVLDEGVQKAKSAAATAEMDDPGLPPSMRSGSADATKLDNVLQREKSYAGFGDPLKVGSKGILPEKSDTIAPDAFGDALPQQRKLDFKYDGRDAAINDTLGAALGGGTPLPNDEVEAFQNAMDKVAPLKKDPVMDNIVRPKITDHLRGRLKPDRPPPADDFPFPEQKGNQSYEPSSDPFSTDAPDALPAPRQDSADAPAPIDAPPPAVMAPTAVTRGVDLDSASVKEEIASTQDQSPAPSPNDSPAKRSMNRFDADVGDSAPIPITNTSHRSPFDVMSGGSATDSINSGIGV